MKKSVLLGTIAVSLAFCFGVYAQGGKTYIRKTIKPQFFVPEKEFDHTEKLPEFYYSYDDVYGSNEIQKTKIVEAIKEAEEDPIVLENEGETPLEPDMPSKVVRGVVKYMDYKSGDLDKDPEYRSKYDNYVEDLKVIAKTGVAPNNFTLMKDLAKMNSNDRFLVR